MSEHTNVPEGEGTSPIEGTAQSGSQPRRGRGRGVIIGGTAAALVAAGGVAALASTMLGGGDKQPEEVLPGSSIVFTKVDLNPGVAQKVGAFRLMDKLPEAKNALSSGDPKKALFELAKSKESDLSDIDYATDIEPWLGDRVGYSLLAPEGSGKEPVAIVAVAVKDEAKAKEGIARLESKAAGTINKAKAQGKAAGDAAAKAAAPGAKATATKSPAGSDNETVKVFKDGYILIAAKKDEARLQAELAKPNLKANETFTGDMGAIGETGVMSGWVDGPKVLELNADSSTPAAMQEIAELQGRSAFALRFASDYLEFAQVGRGQKMTIDAKPLKDLSNLPADTAGFYSFAGGSDAVKQIWPMIKKFASASGAGDVDAQLKQLEQQTGLVLPADLQTLLGDQFDVVVAKQDFRKLTGMPKVGARMWTDTTKAQSILDKIVGLANQRNGGNSGFTLASKATNGHLDVALDEGYRTTLATAGTLSSTAGFATVLPQLESSVAAMYVNLDAVEDQYLDEVPAEYFEFVKALQSVGMTAQPAKDGEQHSVLRLSVN